MDTVLSGSKKSRPLSPAKKAAISVAAGMLLFYVFAIAVLRMSALSALAAVLFQLLCVALPGIAVTKLLRIALTPLESLCISYGLGFGVVVLVYFPFGLMRRTDLIPFALLAVSVLSAVILILTRRRPYTARADRGELQAALIVAFISSAIASIAFSAAYLDPSLSGLHFYYHDAMNAVSLTASAKLGYPFHFLQMAGVTYWYHPFTYFYTASMSLCTGISAFDVTTKLLIFTVTPYVACIFAAMAMRLTGKRSAAALAALLSGVLPVGGLYYYFFEDLLGFMPGIAFGGAAVLLFMEAQSLSKKINRWHLLSSLFMILCLGAKGPVAVTIMFGICFALLVQLIAERDLWVFPKGLCFAVPFFVLYFYLYGSAVSESMEVSFAHLALLGDLAQRLRDSMGIAKGGETVLIKTICAIHYCITCLPIVTAAFVCGIVKLIKSKGKDTLGTFMAGSTALGYVFVNMFRQAGSSEIYFLYANYWFAVVIVVSALVGLMEQKERIKLAVPICLLCFLLIGVTVNRSFVPLLKNGINNAVTYSYYNPDKLVEQQEMDAHKRRPACFSPEEYEGYIFMRDNLPDSAVICDYRYEDYNKFFLGCAFSEKMYLLEGWGYVTMEDSNDNTFEKGQRDNYISSLYKFRDEAFIPILRDFGATHIVVTEYITPGWELTAGYTNLIFENDSIRIYEIII